jgi:hypothetical protein
LVKIQTKTIRKRYGRSKSEYHYKQHLLPFPIKQNEALEPFLKKELQFKMNVEDDTLHVTLKKQKDADIEQ